MCVASFGAHNEFAHSETLFNKWFYHTFKVQICWLPVWPEKNHQMSIKVA